MKVSCLVTVKVLIEMVCKILFYNCCYITKCSSILLLISMLARGNVKHVKPLKLIYVRMKINECGHYNEIKTIACVRCILSNTKLFTWSIVAIQQLSYILFEEYKCLDFLFVFIAFEMYAVSLICYRNFNVFL